MAGMALPPNWSRYTTNEGKEYFHNSVTNTTQWDKPVVPDPPAFDGGHTAGASASDVMADVFTYTPSPFELEVPNQQGPPADNSRDMLHQQTVPLGNMSAFGSSAGKEGMPESDMVSLIQHQAPTSQHATAPTSSAPSAGGGLGGGIGGLVTGAIVGAASNAAANAAEGAPSWLLASAQQLFDVSTRDVVQRLRLVLVPYPPQEDAAKDLKMRPDFYGPFWVATTAVLFLAATGNFARLVEAGSHEHFKADYGLVTLAALMVYGCLVGVPVVARVSLLASGEDAGSVDFRQMICVCGYALAPAIPASILCIVPLSGVRWLVTMLGLIASLIFLRGQLWDDLADKTPWLKWLLIVAPCGAQVIVYAVYRLHFF